MQEEDPFPPRRDYSRKLNGVFPHHVSVVGGAKALLGDAHAEARQAAIFVSWAQVEVSGLAAGAGGAFHVHLQHRK